MLPCFHSPSTIARRVTAEAIRVVRCPVSGKLSTRILRDKELKLDPGLRDFLYISSSSNEKGMRTRKRHELGVKVAQ